MKLLQKLLTVILVIVILTVSSGAEVDMISLSGDANLDSVINLADVTAILKSIAGWNITISTSNADVTDDGKISLSDVSDLLKYIAKWDVIMLPAEDEGFYGSNGMYIWDLTEYQDDKIILNNPDKGLYIHYLDNCLDRYGVKNGEYLMPDDLPQGLPIDHIYIRVAWCHIEPEENVYNWELIDNIIEPWTAAGVKVAFRITCKETSASQYYATPEWVKDAGAAGKELADAWEPEWNDPVFLEKLRDFHLAFAEKYDSNPNVIYTDIGSLGDWGEGHTTFGSQTTYTYDTLLEHMNIYTEAYKNTRIVINDDIITHEGISGRFRNELLDYIEEHSFSVRDDSIATKWHYDNYFDEVYGKTSVKVPAVFIRYSDDAPMILELDHYGNTITSNNDTWQNGQTLLNAVKQTHATYAGFHYYPVDWYNDGNEKIAGELVNTLGYWFFPETFSFAETDKGMKYELELKNKGASRCYKDYTMTLYLVQGNEIIAVNANDFSVSSITAGESATAVFESGSLSSGEWTAYIRISNEENREILLAMSEDCHTDEYGYKAGIIRIK